MDKDRINEISYEIIGAAIQVHDHLGPGLLESAYEECLCRELALQKIRFERQVPLPIDYKGVRLDCGYRLDIVVEGAVIVEVKAVEEIKLIHEAQLLTYLRLTRQWLGLFINFNVPYLKHRVRRLVCG